MSDNDDTYRPFKRIKLFLRRGCAQLNNVYSDMITSAVVDNGFDNLPEHEDPSHNAKSEVNEEYPLVDDVEDDVSANNRYAESIAAVAANEVVVPDELQEAESIAVLAANEVVVFDELQEAESIAELQEAESIAVLAANEVVVPDELQEAESIAQEPLDDEDSVGYPPVGMYDDPQEEEPIAQESSDDDDSVDDSVESDDDSAVVAVVVQEAPPANVYVNSFTLTQREVNRMLQLNVSLRNQTTFEKNVFHGSILLVYLVGHKMDRRTARRYFAHCEDMTRLKPRTIREKYNLILKDFDYRLDAEENKWESVFADVNKHAIVVVIFSVKISSGEKHMRQVAIYHSKSYVLMPLLFSGKSLMVGSRLRLAAAQTNNPDRRKQILSTIKRHLYPGCADLQMAAVYKLYEI